MCSLERRRTGSPSQEVGEKGGKDINNNGRLIARFSTTPLNSTLAAGIVRELIKHLLYIRRQIPSTWAEVEKMSFAREKAQREPARPGGDHDGSSSNTRRLRRMRKLEASSGKRAAKLYDAARPLMRDGTHAGLSVSASGNRVGLDGETPVRPSRMDEFFAEHDVRRAAVLFGSSIITPKETYIFHFHMSLSEKAVKHAGLSNKPSIPVVSSKLLAAATRKVVKMIITQGYVQDRRGGYGERIAFSVWNLRPTPFTA